MYVLVPVPYIIMLCFLVRGPLLEGAGFGLQHLKVFKVRCIFPTLLSGLRGYVVSIHFFLKILFIYF